MTDSYLRFWFRYVARIARGRARGGVTAGEIEQLRRRRDVVPRAGDALLAAISLSGKAHRSADVTYSAAWAQEPLWRRPTWSSRPDATTSRTCAVAVARVTTPRLVIVTPMEQPAAGVTVYDAVDGFAAVVVSVQSVGSGSVAGAASFEGDG